MKPYKILTATKMRLVNQTVNSWKIIFDKHWMLLSIFMACPIFLIAGQNLSLLFIFSLVYRYHNNVSFWNYKHPLQIVVLLLGIGAVISTINVFGEDNFSFAIQVLPNYLYWCLLVWMIISLRSEINFEKIQEGIALGIISCCIIYMFLPSISIPGYIARPTQNSFSLLLICYTPSLCNHIKRKYGITYSVLILAGILLVLLSEGRRAGSLLTFTASSAALFLPKVKTTTLATSLFLVTIGLLFIATDFGEKTIESLNPRVHELIYESDKVLTEDRSYLLRRLMIEKGFTLYEKSPFFGIGLNSFNKEVVEFEGDFIGSEFIIDKEKNNATSSHNSYINILAEGGLFLFIPFLLILIYNTYQFITKFNSRNSVINSLYWGYIAMSVHLYVITGIVNVYVWFLIALVTAASTLKYSGNSNSATFSK